MARENLVFLLGSVAKEPQVVKKGDEYLYAMVYVNVGRGTREVGDKRDYMKCDNPIIMTRDSQWVKEIETWHTNDIVEIKGIVASKKIRKASYCPHCNTRNTNPGALVYINPIFAEKRCHLETQKECLQYIASHREISNQVYVFGTLCTEPKKLTSKSGLTVTQYQVALNRKYRIKTDPPEIKTDYPWVKSYGKNALEDKKRLRVGSEVYIDGCLQARSVLRHSVCGQIYDERNKPVKDENGNPVIGTGCGKRYDWEDRALEMVPYDTEYIGNYYTDEALKAAEEEKRLNAMKKAGMTGNFQEDDAITEEDYENGIDDLGGDKT
jgi:uncharacterized protein with PIN domain